MLENIKANKKITKTFTMSQKLFDVLKSVAKKENVKMTAILADALEEYFVKNKINIGE